MAERHVDTDVPELSRMSIQELQRRLRMVEEAIALVCRACNRQVSKSSEAAAHDRGNRHLLGIDARARRLTHHQLGMSFDEERWCDICGKQSPDAEAFRAHLLAWQGAPGVPAGRD